jgi:hypothetical protein
MLSDSMGFLMGVIFIAAVIMSNEGKAGDETDVKRHHIDDMDSDVDDLMLDPAYSFLSTNIYHTDDTHIDICDDDWK